MVTIKQDPHYTHDRENNEVFTITVTRHSKYAGSFTHSYTIPELREIVEEITVFLEGRKNATN